LGALDFKTKSSYLSEPFYPTGDIEKDFIVIREFYKNTQGRNPEWFNVDGIRPA